MKRILCLTDGFTLGGAERQLVGLGHYLQENGYNVELCCYYKKNFYLNLINSYGLKLTTLEVGNNPLSKLIKVIIYISKGKYDCVIAYKGGATKAACIAKMLGAKFKLIVSERNTTQVISKKEKTKFFLYRYADYIVPNSNSQSNFIHEHYPKLYLRTKTITNFTDTDYFVPKIPQSTDTQNICNIRSVFRIVVAARIAKQKNIIRFINVIRKLKEDHLNITVDWFGNVSAFEEQYEAFVKKHLNECGLEDGTFNFFSASNNILNEYQTCDAFCLPSIYEGFPNVICEAMCCGKPILCSRVCDNPYIVEDGINGYMFDPYDELDMYNVIRKFYYLPEDKKVQMGLKSRQIAIEKVCSDTFTSKYIQLIET